MEKDLWVVNILGGWSPVSTVNGLDGTPSGEWEISVVRDSNGRGKTWWGETNANKILISSSEDFYDEAIPKEKYDSLVRMAEVVAQAWNNEGL